MAKTQIFFDGACHLCSREIDQYRKLDQDMLIEYVDISDPAFSAVRYGLSEDQNFRKYIHVKSAAGDVFTGVDAFNQVWKVLGIFKTLSWAVENKFTRPILKAGYATFAEIRPLLPKRERCETACHR